MLQTNIDQLRHSLEQQGLRMDRVDVVVQDRPGGQQAGTFHGGPFSGGYPGGNGREGTEEQYGPDAQSPSPQRQIREGSTLSVFA
jgi:flagellar hook-length control protein FliK